MPETFTGYCNRCLRRRKLTERVSKWRGGVSRYLCAGCTGVERDEDRERAEDERREAAHEHDEENPQTWADECRDAAGGH